MVSSRFAGGADASPRHQQVGHQHARRVLSPAAAGVRDWCSRHGQLPAGPSGHDVAAGCAGGRAAPDDSAVVRDLAWCRDNRRRAAASSADDRRRRDCRAGRSVGFLRRPSRGATRGHGSGVARDSGLKRLPLSIAMASGGVARQPRIHTAHRLDLPPPPRGRPARASRDRDRRWMPVTGTRLCRDATLQRDARRARDPVAARPYLLDARPSGGGLRRVGRGRGALRALDARCHHRRAPGPTGGVADCARVGGTGRVHHVGGVSRSASRADHHRGR